MVSGSFYAVIAISEHIRNETSGNILTNRLKSNKIITITYREDTYNVQTSKIKFNGWNGAVYVSGVHAAGVGYGL